MDQGIKYHAPSNLVSHEPYLTVWIAELEDGKKMWIQTSADADATKWKRMGEFLEEILINDSISGEDAVNLLKVISKKNKS